MHLFLATILLIITHFAVAQKQWHFGGYYSYGAAWNTHATNKQPLKPNDGSSLGLLIQLDNGQSALGFQASLAHRWWEVRHKIEEGYFMDCPMRAVEMRLQCILPVSKKHSFALGMAPRIATHYHFSVVYVNGTNGGQTESDFHRLNKGKVNALNSSIIASWQYQLHKHWYFFLNAEQDLLNTFSDDVTFDHYDEMKSDEPSFVANSLLTSLSGSIVFLVK